MSAHPSLTHEQIITLRRVLTDLGSLTVQAQRIARRSRISDEEALELLEPILRIRSLLAQIRAAAGDDVQIGDDIPSLSALEAGYLDLEGAIKEKRDEKLSATG